MVDGSTRGGVNRDGRYQQSCKRYAGGSKENSNVAAVFDCLRRMEKSCILQYGGGDTWKH